MAERSMPRGKLSMWNAFDGLHSLEMEVVAYATAGRDHHPRPVPTGETVSVIEPIYREALRKGWTAVEVLGQSMQPDYDDGDFVLIEPAREGNVRPGTVAHVLLNGEGLLKMLDFTRHRENGRMQSLRLLSLNLGYPPIPITEDDWFHLIGVEMYTVRRKRNLR